MRKIPGSLVILALANLAAAPATKPASPTPWSLIVQAGQLPATDSPRSSSLSYAPYPPYSKEWWDMAWDSEQQNTEQFRLLRKARLLMESNGGQAGFATPDMSPTSIKAILQAMNPCRNLANIVADAALFSHLNRNDTEAIARTLDLFNLAGSIRQCHTMITQLVGIGIEALGASNIHIIAPDLSLDPASAGSTRAETKQLIGWLLNETPGKQAWEESIASELKSSEHPSAELGADRKLIASDPAIVDQDIDILKKACQFTNYSQSLSQLSQCNWPTGFVGKTMDRLFETAFRVMADRRMAVVNLAIQLYRADHKGAFPKTLDELVPDYLPTIPTDPYSSTNAPISYEILPHGWPDGKDRPVLFITSGPDAPIGPDPRIDWYNQGKRQVRQYRDLTLPTNQAK